MKKYKTAQQMRQKIIYIKMTTKNTKNERSYQQRSPKYNI